MKKKDMAVTPALSIAGEAEEKLSELNKTLEFGFMDVQMCDNPKVLRLDDHMISLLHADGDADWISRLKNDYSYIVPEEYRKSLRETLKGGSKLSSSFCFEQQMIRHDGSVIDTEIRAVRRHNKNDGHYYHFTVVNITPIHEHKQEILAKQNSHVLEELFDSIIEFDWKQESAVVLHTNIAGMKPLLNLRVQITDVLKKRLPMQIACDDTDMLISFLDETSLQKGNTRIEFHGRSKNSQTTYLMQAIRSDDRKWLLCMRDITKEKLGGNAITQNHMLMDAAAGMNTGVAVYRWEDNEKTLVCANEIAKPLIPYITDQCCRQLTAEKKCEFSYANSEKKICWLEMSSVRNNSLQVIQIEDTTVRHQNLQELKWRQERNRSALKNERIVAFDYHCNTDELYIGYPDSKKYWVEDHRKDFLSDIEFLKRHLSDASIEYVKHLLTADVDLQDKSYTILIWIHDGYRAAQMFCASPIFDKVGNKRIIGHIDVPSLSKERYHSDEETDTLMRLALSSGAEISVGFDADSGDVIEGRGNIIPQSLSRAKNWVDFMPVIHENTNLDVFPESIRNGSLSNICTYLEKNNETASFDILMNPIEKPDNKKRWFGLALKLVKDKKTGRRILFVHVLDIDKKKRRELALVQQSSIDKLTNLLNRDEFSDRCLYSAQNDDHHHHAYVMIDIDYFSKINGTHGHIIGDAILKKTAATIESWARESDLAGRYAGDVFVAYINNADDQIVLQERIRILHTALSYEAAPHIPVTASIGIFNNVNNIAIDDPNKIYDKADTALCKAKQNGGNCYVFYDDSLSEESYVEGYAPLNLLPSKHVYLRMFGYFDLFVDGEAVVFKHAKAKELLALLADRKGGLISPGDAISCLWEDEPCNKTTLSRYRKVAMHLRNTLKAYGIDNIFISNNGQRGLDITKTSCDLFDYLSGKEEYKGLFKGSYLLNYSWGEMTQADLSEDN